MNKMNKKGFTLMEMLIVVAIIAILIAIAIPTFTSTLEKAREATDAANLRAAYAEVMAAALTGEDGTAVSEGSALKKYSKTVGATQLNAGWKIGEAGEDGKINIGGVKVTAVTKGSTWTVEYTEDGDVITIEPTPAGNGG